MSLQLSACGVVQGLANAKQQSDLKAQSQALSNQLQIVVADCRNTHQAPDLNPIRNKVALYRDPSSIETPPPFEIAANDNFPTEAERAAIAEWAKLRDACTARINEVLVVPSSATTEQAVFFQQDWAFLRQANGPVSQLVIALYQQKLTYGEFAQRRYEIIRAAAAAERQFRQATLAADQQRQLQERQLAQQEFQTQMNAWSAYTQAVAARQPQTIRINCVSNQFGGTVTTNCN